MRRGRAGLARATCAAVALAGFAGGCGSSSDDARTKSGADPFSVVATQPGDGTAARRKAAPRFETVARLSATGPSTRSVTIARGAIQWRVRYRCSDGTLTLTAGDRTLARSDCPRSGSRSEVRTGRVRLRIDTPGRWSAVVEQQVDTPLHEPPLAAMRAPGARVVARGRFYDIERFGRGEARLYRLASGRVALRLAPFVTSANVDLHVWLDRARRPRTTVQAERAGHRDIAPLKSTLGEQNYLLPAGTTPADVRSVVIWCEPVRIAYTAATMRP